MNPSPKTTSLLRLLSLKPFLHEYFPVNEPLTKNHSSFKTNFLWSLSSIRSEHFSPSTSQVTLRTRGTIQWDTLSVISAGGHHEHFWHRQGHSLCDIICPAFSLPTMTSPTLLGALENGFGKAVMIHDMPEPCEFSSLWQLPEPRCRDTRHAWTMQVSVSLRVARRGSCGPTRKLILLCTQCSK